MELKNNKNIIIKETDKRESVVIMNKKHYCKSFVIISAINRFIKRLIALRQQGNEQNKKTIPEVWKYFNDAWNRLLKSVFQL